MSEIIIYGKEKAESAEGSHIKGIRNLKAFLQEDKNKFLPIYADIKFVYSDKEYPSVGRVIGIMHDALIVSNNPLYGFDTELCFEYSRTSRKWWLNPIIEKDFPPGKYPAYIDTYSSLDEINKIFVNTMGLPNADCKSALITGLD